MNTVEAFENAPVGATATNKVTEGRAMKVPRIEDRWVLLSGLYVDDESMVQWGYTLDPAPAPTSAREALDLAWELANEVEEGQVIPKGTQYLEVTRSGLRERTAQVDFKIIPGLAPARTLDPLPDPEPDWLDAPAVLATIDACPTQEVWVSKSGGYWECTCCSAYCHWSDLHGVTPLYPKKEAGE